LLAFFKFIFDDCVIVVVVLAVVFVVFVVAVVIHAVIGVTVVPKPCLLMYSKISWKGGGDFSFIF
jgi:hypothetical protein